MGGCGFPKKLKLHLQRDTHRTESLGQRDFPEAKVGTRQLPAYEGSKMGWSGWRMVVQFLQKVVEYRLASS